MLQELRLQMGEAAPPQPPRALFFLPAGFASTHTSPFQTHAASIAFAKRGGLRAPQPPPTLFLNPQRKLETLNPKRKP